MERQRATRDQKKISGLEELARTNAAVMENAKAHGEVLKKYAEVSTKRANEAHEQLDDL